MKIAVTGASGFIGAPLIESLVAAGHSVRALARNVGALRLPPGCDAATFDSSRPLAKGALDGIDAVIHLAGEPIAQRWTPEHRLAIRKSRLEGTRTIAQAAVESGSVCTLISASAIGYYGDRGDEALDETSTPGSDFVAEICREWEAAAQPAREAGLRVVHPRIGVVLHPEGGALKKMLPPFKLGAGGRIGSGRQWLSWIHRADLLALLRFALETNSISGPMNATAPAPVTNADFTRALGRALHRPTIFPVPAAALKIAFGEMSFVLLTGQRVLPKKALAAGFAFQFPEIDKALAQLFGRAAAA